MLRFVQLYVMAPAKRTLDCSHRNYWLIRTSEFGARFRTKLVHFIEEIFFLCF